MRKHLIRTLAVIAAIALLVVIGFYAIADTDWGRGQVRKRLEAMIQGNSHGIVRIGRISGNLLNGFMAHDFVVTDSTGAPFIKIDSVAGGYSLNTLRQQHVEFDNLRLYRPVIVLDRQPGGKWNWDRIFPRDTLTHAGRKKTGWGTWIKFTHTTIVDGDLTVRSPWSVNAALKGAAAAAALKLALSDEGRYRLETVPGGYQKVSSFHHLQANIPVLRLEDPAFKTRFADVASLSGLAEPFKPPTIQVKSLVGQFDFTTDS
ncbi:MAG: hypothetical protein ABI875_02890, partial [Gemmatimonadales bacterium]